MSAHPGCLMMVGSGGVRLRTVPEFEAPGRALVTHGTVVLVVAVVGLGCWSLVLDRAARLGWMVTGRLRPVRTLRRHA